MLFYVVVIQSLSRVWLFVTPWTAACQSSLSFSIFRSLLKLMSSESVMPSNHLNFCCPFLLLPSIFPAAGFFPMSWLFASSGQSIGPSASVLPKSIQGWFPLEFTDLISLLSRRLSRVFSSTTDWKHQFLKNREYHLWGVRLWARLGISESLLHPFHWLEFSYVVTPIGKRGWGMTMSFRVKRRESDLGGSSQPVSTMTILFKYLFSMKPSLITLYKTAATLQLHSIFSSCFIFFPSVALTALPESVYFTSLSYSLSGM